MPDCLNIKYLTDFTNVQDWHLSLLHADPFDLLIWITRGQGLLHTDVSRRGVGANTAILIPHGQVFALDIVSQANGLVANMPPIHNSCGIEKSHQLRIRNAKQISQLSGFIEAAQREISKDPHFSKVALRAPTLDLAMGTPPNLSS